jgi:hypothetical protein
MLLQCGITMGPKLCPTGTSLTKTGMTLIKQPLKLIAGKGSRGAEIRFPIVLDVSKVATYRIRSFAMHGLIRRLTELPACTRRHADYVMSSRGQSALRTLAETLSCLNVKPTHTLCGLVRLLSQPNVMALCPGAHLGTEVGGCRIMESPKAGTHLADWLSISGRRLYGAIALHSNTTSLRSHLPFTEVVGLMKCRR